jgi:cell division septation protein DedD
MDDEQDQERENGFTLSTGKLLVLFLGLVVVCALFFGFGYTLGRGTAKSVAANQAPTNTLTPPPSTGNTAPQPCVPTSYQPVAETAPAPPVESAPAAETPAAPQPVAAPQPAAKAGKTPAKPQPVAKPAAKPAAPATASGFMVQVAAVSQKDDAERLRLVLTRKRYPVVILPSAADKLLHVQVGPVSSAAEAEALKKRLIADGYNPIVKH